jgi:hypothetical protein
MRRCPECARFRSVSLYNEDFTIKEKGIAFEVKATLKMRCQDCDWDLADAPVNAIFVPKHYTESPEHTMTVRSWETEKSFRTFHGCKFYGFRVKMIFECSRCCVVEEGVVLLEEQAAEFLAY